MMSLSERINIKIEKTDKFTRNILTVNFIVPLDPKTASYNAVLAGVMGLGCAEYTTQDQINCFLEEQYGATFSSYVQRVGGYQVVRFAVTFIRGAFVLNGENLEKRMFDFLETLLRRPLLENGMFREDLFSTERENLIQKIRSKVNEKRSYSLDRCVKETHRGEPFGVSADGEIAILEAMTCRELYPAYERLLSDSVVLISGIGDFEEKKVSDFAERLFGKKTKQPKQVSFSIQPVSTPPKRIVEEFPVNQSVLALGFRKKISSFSENLFDFLVFCSLYGGSPVSKLFMNVREKLSLCYFCSSIDSWLSGSMFVIAGIAASNREKAYDEIMHQLENIRNSEFSDAEIDEAKKSLIHDYLKISDELFLKERFLLKSFIGGQNLSVKDIIEKISAVSRDGIVCAANNTLLDTEYFLKGTAEAPEEV